MGFRAIRIDGRRATLHSAIADPSFHERNVLSADPWDFVSLWFNRKHLPEAQFYWDQAKQFHYASINLSPVASPLTSYYSMLNATKALLTAKGIAFSEDHGVSGDSKPGKIALKKEVVEFKSGGVLPALCRYLHDPHSPNDPYELQTLLYQLPFIHRAFVLTFTSKSDLFIPLNDPKFVVKEGSSEAWFCAEINPRYVGSYLKSVLPDGYERDHGVDDAWIVRRKNRFTWTGDTSSHSEDLERLTNYHRTVRKHFIPILASTNRWYMLKNVKATEKMDKSTLPVIYAAMHRLSELARYEPTRLQRHFDAQHNWLLSEFIKVAPAQFLLHTASEITGREFIEPYAARLPEQFSA